MKILLVHTQPSTILSLAVNLFKGDHEVITAMDADSAIEIFRTESPNLVITNTDLPTISGFELANQLRNFSRTYVPIVVLSTDELQQKVEWIYGNGNLAYSTNQYDNQDILSLVSSLSSPRSSVYAA